ncbi:MAG: DUF4418 family protein [Betaproteobacteria bacterium]
MKKLVVITAFVGGLLLILVPRYILPACEYEGFSRMHCSDTAKAEYISGALLMTIGVITFFFKKHFPLMISAATACFVFGISFWLPDKFGYCQSPRMPCHYGMVPGVRFVAVISSGIMIGAMIALVRSQRKKGNS